MACFADSNVSHGSVATSVKYGWIFTIHLTTNLPMNLSVKQFKSVKIWQNYGHESVATILWRTLYATGSNTVQHSALRRIRGSTKDRANSSQLV